MIKKLFIIIFTLLISVINVNNVCATHIAGGDLSFRCIDSNTYIITLKLYRDCSGAQLLSAFNIKMRSSCADTLTASLPLLYTKTVEVSQLCPSLKDSSSCKKGAYPGMEAYFYEDTVILTSCPSWKISWEYCCRNIATNVKNRDASNGYEYYIETTILNPSTCNNSPVFTSQPIPYVCVNQNVKYNFGTVETDGDSMYYSFISAKFKADTNLTYIAPYSYNNPINGITLNANTGELQFIPTTIGKFIVVVQVEEYNTSGVLISKVMRDIQFVVLNCSNQAPSDTSGTIQNLLTTGTKTSSRSLEFCDGGSFSFDIEIADPNAVDMLSLSSNVSQVLPGATFTYTKGNPAKATIAWTSPGKMPYFNSFIVLAQDDACPTTAQQYYTYQMNILPSTVSNPDVTICGTQQAQLKASGGDSFTWSVISGDPMITGTNFSCDTCSQPIATPASTTTYQVVSNLTTSNCVARDTVTVFVVPDFTYSLKQEDSTICLLEKVQFEIIPDSAGSYTYSWTPATYLDNPVKSNPTATVSSPGIYTYIGSITSANGCSHQDTVNIDIYPYYVPDIAIQADSLACTDSIQIKTNLGSSTPASCALSSSNCSSVTNTYKLGAEITGEYATSPFNGLFVDGQHLQLLYRASELNALGFSGGKISEIAFYITSKGSIMPYGGFTVQIGCTSLNELPSSAFQTNVKKVYGPLDYQTTALTWNTIPFSNSYDWDGVSNLIIDICWGNSGSITGRDAIYTTTTTYRSTIESDFSGCSSFVDVNFFKRPTIRFGACGASYNPSDYSFLWSPSAGLSSDTVQNPMAFPSASTTYTVTVTHKIGGCMDTDSTFIKVTNQYDATILSPDTTYCTSDKKSYTYTTVDTGGIWSGKGMVKGVFSPSVAGKGTYTLTYTFIGSGKCGSTDNITIVVLESPDPSILSNGPYCILDTSVLLSVADTGGIWKGTGITDTIKGRFKPSVAGAGTHTVIYSIKGLCGSADTIDMVVVSSYDATITPVSPLCITDSVISLTAVDSGGVWTGNGITDSIKGTFSPTLAGSGNHTITYHIAKGCVDTKNTSVTVEALKKITIEDAGPFCTKDADAFLTVSDTGGIWMGKGITDSINGIFSPSAVGQDTPIISYTLLNTCSDKDSISIIVRLSADASILPPFTYCRTDNAVQLNAVGIGGVWSGNGITDSNNGSFSPSVANTGTHQIIHTIAGSCPDADTVSVTVLDVDASFVPKPKKGFIPLQVTFENNTTPDTIRYSWSFGDGNTSSELAPSHQYVVQGEYEVILQAENYFGCVDVFTMNIVVLDTSALTVFNVFSPNGDNVNDEFKVPSKGLTEFKAVIYNRWGKKIYEWEDANGSWDGRTLNGQNAADGVYYYIITAKGIDEISYNEKGYVTLIRGM